LFFLEPQDIAEFEVLADFLARWANIGQTFPEKSSAFFVLHKQNDPSSWLIALTYY